MTELKIYVESNDGGNLAVGQVHRALAKTLPGDAKLSVEKYVKTAPGKPKPFWRRCSPAGIDKSDPQYNPVMTRVWREVTYKDGYGLLLAKDKTDERGRWYFQVECERPDIFTGELGIGRGGKAYLSPHANVSELTRTVFGLFLAYEEHEAREFFKWRDRAVFGPHISTEALWEVADRLDFRAPKEEDAAEAKPDESKVYVCTTKSGHQFLGRWTLAPGIDYFWDPVLPYEKGANQLTDPVTQWYEYNLPKEDDGA